MQGPQKKGSNKQGAECRQRDSEKKKEKMEK
jgi:hypothetical protein